MRRDAIGFYWTLPVAWAGFCALPADVDAAAALSRTIRYQRDLVRQYGKRNGYRLIHEEVFLEIEPDRGSDLVVAPLQKVATLCRKHRAILLYVDFAVLQGWRSHGPMQAWCQAERIELHPVWPEPLDIDGKTFEPAAHFESWRRRQRAWTASKAQRAAAAAAHARPLRDNGMRYADIAASLNAKGLVNLSGRAWTTDNLRKFLRSALP